MRYVVGFLLVSLFACAPLAAQESWRQWRGPNGTGGIDAELPIQWSAEENVRWKTPLPGRGHSSPVVSDGLIFLTTAVPVGEKFPPRRSGRPGAHNNLPVESSFQFVVVAVNADDGKLAWQTVVKEAIPLEGAHETGSLASASAVCDKEHVYAFFGSQGLYCLDRRGEVQWKREFGQMHSKHGHGEGASPVLFGDVVAINWDHEEQSFVTALDKNSGETLWRKDRKEVTSWSTPIVVEVNGKAQLIVAGTNRVRGYDLESGDEIWQCGGMSANIVATPVYENGTLIVGSSYEKQYLMAIRLAEARGDITGSEAVLWDRMQRTPYVPSMLLHRGVVYFLAHYQNVFTAVSAENGEPDPGTMRLGALGSIYASPVAAGKHVYVTDLFGTTMVVEFGENPRPVAINPLDEPVNASLAFYRKRILIRGEKHLFCIE